MSTIWMMRGIPGSGKSTWAKAKVELGKGFIKRVNRDDLRAMMDNSNWSKTNESFVVHVRNEIIAAAIMEGCGIIVDDTNLTNYHLLDMQTIAANLKAELLVVDVDTHPDICTLRNMDRAGIARVPDDAMKRMKELWPKRPKYESTLVVTNNG